MTEPVRGPLDDLVREAGATMIVRDGRWVAAHYGSRAGEVAACQRAVGIADRFDRATLEIGGDPAAVDRVVEAVTHRPASHTDAVRAGHAWWCRITPERVVLRCEAAYVRGVPRRPSRPPPTPSRTPRGATSATSSPRSR